MMIDEFLSRMAAHELFYLKDSNRRVYFKQTYDDGFVLGHAKGGQQGFIAIASNYYRSKLDGRVIYFLNNEGHVIFEIFIDEWEVNG